MATRDYIIRLVDWFRGLRKFLVWLFGGSIVAYYISTKLWEKYEPKLSELTDSIFSSVLDWAGNNPLKAIASLTLLIFCVLMFLAYRDTKPPRGLLVNWGNAYNPKGLGIEIKNKTGVDLENCYLRLNWVKGENIEGQENVKQLPTEIPFLENWNGMSIDRVIIENEQSGIYNVVDYHDEELFYYLPIIIGSSTIDGIKFGNNIKAEYQFQGKKPTGEGLVRKFEVILEIDDGEIVKKRIWK